MCCSVLAPGFLYTMCSVNVFVIDYILWLALQAHNYNVFVIDYILQSALQAHNYNVFVSDYILQSALQGHNYNVFVSDYILWRAVQGHNNSCCQFCECVWCMCMLWEEVEHAVWHVPGAATYCHPPTPTLYQRRCDSITCKRS